MSSFEARAIARRKARITEYAANLRQTETLTAQALWQVIRCSALGVTFRRQVPIGGCFIGVFVANGIKLVVEVDGTTHRQRGAADARRDAKLQRLGFTVLWLPAKLVERNLPVAVLRIRETIAALVSP